MAGKHLGSVFDAQISFDGRDTDVAHKSEDADPDAGKDSLEKRHGRHPNTEDRGERRGRQHSAQEAFPGLVRAHTGHNSS